MQKERGVRNLAIISICVAVVALTVGYAALSQVLNINGTTTLKTATWNVHFVDGSINTPVTADGTLTGGAVIDKPATLNTTTMTFAVSLYQPGDSITYTWAVQNEGSLDAKLGDTPVLTGLTEAAAKKVNYTLTYGDGNSIQAGDELKSQETKTIKLTVTFDAAAEATDLASTDTALPLSTTLTYVQK